MSQGEYTFDFDSLPEDLQNYILKLRSECKKWRLRLREVEAECAGLRIALAQKLDGASGREWLNSAGVNDHDR